MELELNGQSSRLPDYKSEIAELIKSNLTPPVMKERLLDYHENDIAAALSELSEDMRQRLYAVLDRKTLAGVIEYVDGISDCLLEMPPKKRVGVLSYMEPSLVIEYLSELDKEARATLLALMPEDMRVELKMLSAYDKDEIGSKMATNYISVKEGVDVRGAMSELVKQAADNDNVSTIYVTDNEGALVGAIDLKDLIRARSTSPLEDIIMTSYPYVYATEPIDDCIDRLREYSEDSIPVLDADNRLMGVITAQDLTEVVEEEIGEDYARLGGLTSHEDIEEPVLKSIGKRLPWLVILFALGLLVSGVVGLFDGVVASLPLIVSFQSLILGMAGNVGTQSLAVTIRSLVDEELSAKEKAYLVFKEARVGFINGILLGILSFVLVGAYLFLRGNDPSLAFSVSMCTAMALLISMVLSGISGTTIPLLLKRMKIDPAVASGPFITTINDLVAVVTYYGLAWLFLLGI